MKRLAAIALGLLLCGAASASLEEDGIWKAGVWATTVWADGVWAEGGGGDPTVEVPDVLGMDEATADAAFEGVGLDTGAVFETCSEEDLGVVVIQIPPSGAQAAPGSTVDIFLSTGVACVGRPGGTRHGFGFGFGVQ